MLRDFIHTTFTKNPFAVFAPQPLGVTFENQEKGEKIILLLRAHIITLIFSLLTPVLLALIPIFILPALSLIRLDISNFLSAGQIFWIVIFWYLLTFGVAFYKFIFWYFNVYLVTSERIVDIDFKGLLNKETSYARLKQIQDISPKIVGFFGTFFHYGDVFVQTAAERPEFDFKNVANPDLVAQEILEQAGIEEQEMEGKVGENAN